MKNSISTFLLLLFVLILVSAASVFRKTKQQSPAFDKSDIIGCSPSAQGETIADGNGKLIPVLAGWGNYSYPVSTNNDSTQFYFNQGLNLYYSYHPKEALASFKEAARFDETCAMAYWGQALALGPFYNTYYYKMGKEVPAVIKLMSTYSSNANEKEKELINAMQQRYSNDMTNADRSYLDSNYTLALSLAIKKYGADNDIKALYIDAVMLQHKWDFWYNDGKPKPWTPEVVQLCEDILATHPGHPAALHYYIHLTEASRHPEVALHGADVLKDAMPGVPHMVHMASHMYQRNGLYAKGVSVNENANTAGNIEDSLAPLIGRGQNTAIHFFAVQSYCALSAGMYNKALPLYRRVKNRVIELNGSLENDPYMQFVYMMPEIAAVRLGKWQQLLLTPSPDKKWKYASSLADFAKGMAHVHNKNLTRAKECLHNLQLNLKDSLLAIRLMPQNKPVQSCRIAEGILKGEILFEEGKTGEAIAALQQAVAEEDGLVYTEPNNWLIPARQYLGAYLLKMNKAKEAEDVYREDLVLNPGNGWSLLGLHKSLLAQNKMKEASAYKARYIKAFEAADVHPVTSVF